jgi:glucan-binding YG repeat protein/lysophospholipase L1-like esterase
MSIKKRVVSGVLVSFLFVLSMMGVAGNAAADTVLGPDVTNYLNSRSNTVSVGVYDANTGETYTYNSSKSYNTLSIVKMSILANVLYKQIPINSYENSLLTKMIVSSDNGSASTMWRRTGSESGAQSFFNMVGMNNTNAGAGGWWGRTTTNVTDQLTMMKLFAYPNSFLTDSQRAYGLNLMRNVQADQRWGTGYGLPAGVSVALKNGWYTNGQYVNSVGFVKGQGKSYVIAVLTTNNKSFSYGVDTINTISKMVWNEIPGLGWVSSGGKWFYYTKDGKHKGWLKYNNRWYYLDQTTGTMRTGWVKSGNEWYYLNSDGAMKTGWISYRGAWYFLDHTGVMKTGWVKSAGKWYYLESDGKMETGWVQVEGKWYYLKTTGEMLTGWTFYKNKWYYLNNSGDMATGWINLSGKKYHLKDSGEMATGWQKINNEWFYLQSNGEMLTGWTLYKNKWYYLNPASGKMETSWINLSGKKYYLKDSGEMLTGWQKINGEWYSLRQNGELLTGWTFYKNDWYYLNVDTGKMETGWIDLSGKKYYLDAGGAMVTDWQKIDGKWYYFTPKGLMAANTTIQGYKLGPDGAWIQINYVALGDSLASGMTPEGQDRPMVNGVDPDWGYPNYIARNFSKAHELLNFANYGVSGYKADDLLADLEKENVQQAIKNATHITIDIGINDIYPSLQNDPARALEEIPAVSEKISTILAKIDQLNPEVKVFVMGYYNPMPYGTDPLQKELIPQAILALNDQIQHQANQHGDTFISTTQIINEKNHTNYLPNQNRFNPNLFGYQAIAEEFWKYMQ